MFSVPKKKTKKVTVKSDTWFVNYNLVESLGFQESPLFGTESTKFYWRVELQASILLLNKLYLASCAKEKISLNVVLDYGVFNPSESKKSFNGVVSLDKIQTIGSSELPYHSVFTSTELTFEESYVPIAKLTQSKHLEALSSQLLSLQLDSKPGDITLVTSDGGNFPAHKRILALRSPVFAAMFQHEEFSENKKNQVEIDDVTSEVMEALLKYIYSADVTGIDKIADDLLKAADKYDIPLLVELCAQSLMEQLTTDTAAKCFYLADLYRLEDAKKQVVSFIAANRQAVRNSDGWKKFIGHAQLEQLFDLLLP